MPEIKKIDDAVDSPTHIILNGKVLLLLRIRKRKYKKSEMKNIGYVIVIIFMVAGCHRGANRPEGKPVVLVTILPQKTFVEKIGGDDFRISVLVPHGANPTTYSLLPAQMAEISEAAVWFRMGYVGFELSWNDRITGTNPAMKIADLSEGLPLISGSSHEGSGERSGVDPHTWMSPLNVRIMAVKIKEELTRLRPENAERYTERCNQFISEIDSTDAGIREILAPSTGKTVITYHPSLTYFARDYGLQQLSVEQGGKEPTPAHMADLATRARAQGIRVIYIQSEFDLELARVFAEEINGKVVQIVPLRPDWSTNLLEISRIISEN